MENVKQDAIPQLDPGTYTYAAVIRFVIGLIKEEDRRLDMSCWISTFRGTTVQRRIFDTKRLPSCGTVACVGGWILIALRKVVGDPLKDRHLDGWDALRAMGFQTPPRWIGEDEDTLNPEWEARKDHWRQVERAREELDNIFGMTNLDADDVIVQLEQYLQDYYLLLNELTVTVTDTPPADVTVPA